ncbi:hypothetical protein Pelo_2644 [Pelomyxa schiedti]|nr:hypothetical protein Pelo_2644 [Pelomyxa schiedti]
MTALAVYPATVTAKVARARELVGENTDPVLSNFFNDDKLILKNLWAEDSQYYLHPDRTPIIQVILALMHLIQEYSVPSEVRNKSQSPTGYQEQRPKYFIPKNEKKTIQTATWKHFVCAEGEHPLGQANPMADPGSFILPDIEQLVAEMSRPPIPKIIHGVWGKDAHKTSDRQVVELSYLNNCVIDESRLKLFNKKKSKAANKSSKEKFLLHVTGVKYSPNLSKVWQFLRDRTDDVTVFVSGLDPSVLRHCGDLQCHRPVLVSYRLISYGVKTFGLFPFLGVHLMHCSIYEDCVKGQFTCIEDYVKKAQLVLQKKLKARSFSSQLSKFLANWRKILFSPRRQKMVCIEYGVLKIRVPNTTSDYNKIMKNASELNCLGIMKVVPLESVVEVTPPYPWLQRQINRDDLQYMVPEFLSVCGMKPATWGFTFEETILIELTKPCSVLLIQIFGGQLFQQYWLPFVTLDDASIDKLAGLRVLRWCKDGVARETHKLDLRFLAIRMAGAPAHLPLYIPVDIQVADMFEALGSNGLVAKVEVIKGGVCSVCQQLCLCCAAPFGWGFLVNHHQELSTRSRSGTMNGHSIATPHAAPALNLKNTVAEPLKHSFLTTKICMGGSYLLHKQFARNPQPNGAAQHKHRSVTIASTKIPPKGWRLQCLSGASRGTQLVLAIVTLLENGEIDPKPTISPNVYQPGLFLPKIITKDFDLQFKNIVDLGSWVVPQVEPLARMVTSSHSSVLHIVIAEEPTDAVSQVASHIGVGCLVCLFNPTLQPLIENLKDDTLSYMCVLDTLRYFFRENMFFGKQVQYRKLQQVAAVLCGYRYLSRLFLMKIHNDYMNGTLQSIDYYVEYAYRMMQQRLFLHQRDLFYQHNYMNLLKIVHVIPTKLGVTITAPCPWATKLLLPCDQEYCIPNYRLLCSKMELLNSQGDTIFPKVFQDVCSPWSTLIVNKTDIYLEITIRIKQKKVSNGKTLHCVPFSLAYAISNFECMNVHLQNCRCSNLLAAEMKACHHQGKCEDYPCPFLHFRHFVTSSGSRYYLCVGRPAYSISYQGPCGMPEGLTNRLECYIVKRNYKSAVKYLLKAANTGDCSAQFALAENDSSGKGVEKDESVVFSTRDAMNLLHRSTTSMMPETNHISLGEVHETGHGGVAKDVREAVRCHRPVSSTSHMRKVVLDKLKGYVKSQKMW